MALNSGESGTRIKGFSLIEVVVAIAILALLLGGVLAIFSQGFQVDKRARNQAIAVNLARAAAEEYSNWTKLTELDDTPWITPHNGPVNDIYNLGEVNLNNVTYDRTIQIFSGPVSPGQLKRLEAVITWPEGGTTKNLTISTLKADY